MLERTYVHVAVRDKLRAEARKGWVGTGNAFDSLVTTGPCFESTRHPRVGTSPHLALLSLRPPSSVRPRPSPSAPRARRNPKHPPLFQTHPPARGKETGASTE